MPATFRPIHWSGSIDRIRTVPWESRTISSAAPGGSLAPATNSAVQSSASDDPQHAADAVPPATEQGAAHVEARSAGRSGCDRTVPTANDLVSSVRCEEGAVAHRQLAGEGQRAADHPSGRIGDREVDVVGRVPEESRRAPRWTRRPSPGSAGSRASTPQRRPVSAIWQVNLLADERHGAVRVLLDLSRTPAGGTGIRRTRGWRSPGSWRRRRAGRGARGWWS